MASAYIRSKGEGLENVFQVICIQRVDFLLISSCDNVCLVCIFNDSLLLCPKLHGYFTEVTYPYCDTYLILPYIFNIVSMTYQKYNIICLSS
jgi:hypothetical protein